MGLFRELCVSFAAVLFVLPFVWPVPAESPELVPATHAAALALEKPGTNFISQPTELSDVGPIKEEAIRPKAHQAADAALMAAIEIKTPEEMAQAVPLKPTEAKLFAANDAKGPTFEQAGGDISSQPTERTVIAPMEEEAVEPRGHQAADAALMAAVESGTPDEVSKAALLKPPAPTLFADVNLTTQRLTVSDKSGVLHTWKISSARSGYVTPVGLYKPQWTSRMHYSKQYYNSPMPYSVFFHRGYAVHGTTAVGQLGRPASHGCVRLRTSNAKKFYNLVHKHGKGLTKIAVRGTRPASSRARNYRPQRVRNNRPRRRYRARTRRPRYRASGPFYAYGYRQPRERYYRRRRYSRY